MSEWEADGKGWRLTDEEDYYEIIPYRRRFRSAAFRDQWTVWKNGIIWLATVNSFSAGDQRVANEIRTPQFQSDKPANRMLDEDRQRKRLSGVLELKRKEQRESMRKQKTVKLYRW